MTEIDLHEIHENWEWVTLDTVLSKYESGKRPKGGVRNIETGIPSIGGEHLTWNGNFDFTEIKFVPVEFFNDMKKGKIEKGDILIVKDGATTGKTSIVRDSFPFNVSAVNEHVFLARTFNEINNYYIFYYLFSIYGQKFVKKNFKGSAQGGINLSFFKNTFVPIPPINEQIRIVSKIEELFTRLDTGIYELKQAKERLKIYRQSVLKHAFEGKLTEEWRISHKDQLELVSALINKINKQKKNSKKNKRKSLKIDSSKLYALPEEWTWTNMGSIGEVTGGLTKNSKREDFPLNLPYLRVANVYANKLDLNEIKEIGIKESEIERVRLKKGDLLVVEGNGSKTQIGRVALWDGSIDPCVHQNHLIKVRFLPVEIGNYVLSFFLSGKGRELILDVASSTSGLHTLSISKVSALPIPFPPLLEQLKITEEIGKKITIINELSKYINHNLIGAKILRQSILNKAFIGKLVQQDPKDEPAKKILERINAEKVKHKPKRKISKKNKSTQKVLI